MNKTYHIPDAYIDGAVAAVNAMRKWLNTNVQEIRDLAQAGTRNADGQLNKRTMDKIRPILDTCPCRVYVNANYSHAIYLDIDTHYPISGEPDGCYTVSYSKESVCLAATEPFEGRRLFTAGQVRNDIAEYGALWDKAYEARSDAQTAAFKVSLFEN